MFIIPKMVLIDDTLHHINTVMGNQFIVFFVCGGNWLSVKLFPADKIKTLFARHISKSNPFLFDLGKLMKVKFLYRYLLDLKPISF
jgi:hypothetical protein